MRIDIVTLFPGMVTPVLAESMLGRAQTRGLVDIRVVNLRDYAGGRHRVTDDYQFGGGGGMVLTPEPLCAAVEALRTPGARVVLMDPRGRAFAREGGAARADRALARGAGDVAHVARAAGFVSDGAANGSGAQAAGAIRPRGNAGAARRPCVTSTERRKKGL